MAKVQAQQVTAERARRHIDAHEWLDMGGDTTLGRQDMVEWMWDQLRPRVQTMLNEHIEDIQGCPSHY